MDHFLLIYTGSDKGIKVRLLSRDDLTPEAPISDVEYFHDKTEPIPNDRSQFHIFSPVKGTPGKFDFKQLQKHYISRVTQHDSAWQYFDRINHERLEALYESINNTITEIARSEMDTMLLTEEGWLH
jgi:hypothetical protein